MSDIRINRFINSISLTYGIKTQKNKNTLKRFKVDSFIRRMDTATRSTCIKDLAVFFIIFTFSEELSVLTRVLEIHVFFQVERSGTSESLTSER